MNLCGLMDCSPPGSFVLGVLQARILERVAIPSPGDLPNLGIKTRSPALQADSLLTEPAGKPTERETSFQMESSSVSHSVPNSLWTDSMDCSPPGPSVHGIFHGRILEGVAISSSKGSSLPRNQIHVSSVSCIGRQVLYH